MAGPGAVMERRRRRRKERKEKGEGERKREREREREREGRLMSRQLHSRGHQSNTMKPVGRRCLPDGQMPQHRYPSLL